MEVTRERVEAVLDILFGKKARVIPAKVHVGGGVCAGMTFAKPTETAKVDHIDILKAVLTTYEENGLALDLETDDGKTAFMEAILETVREFVARNNRVTLCGRLIFEPKVYTEKRGKVGKPYMDVFPNSLWRDLGINTAPNHDAGWLKMAAQMAEHNAAIDKAPRQMTAKGRKVGRTTVVHCPKCGTEIVIESTEDVA